MILGLPECSSSASRPVSSPRPSNTGSLQHKQEIRACSDHSPSCSGPRKELEERARELKCLGWDVTEVSQASLLVLSFD